MHVFIFSFQKNPLVSHFNCNPFGTSWAKNCTMPITAEKDAEFGDVHFDVSKSEKYPVRAMIKTYQNTESYVCLYQIIQKS